MKRTPPQGTPPMSTDVGGDVSATRASPWAKRWFPVAMVIAVTALAYGVGRVQGALALRQEERRSAQDRAVLGGNLTACEADRSLLEARRSLALVAVSLDRRNFGVAESHRQGALQAFARPSLSSVGEASELATQVRELDLAVDPDPGSKRERVIAVSEAVDRLVTERAGAPGRGATVTQAP